MFPGPWDNPSSKKEPPRAVDVDGKPGTPRRPWTATSGTGHRWNPLQENAPFSCKSAMRQRCAAQSPGRTSIFLGRRDLDSPTRARRRLEEARGRNGTRSGAYRRKLSKLAPSSHEPVMSGLLLAFSEHQIAMVKFRKMHCSSAPSSTAPAGTPTPANKSSALGDSRFQPAVGGEGENNHEHKLEEKWSDNSFGHSDNSVAIAAGVSATDSEEVRRQQFFDDFHTVSRQRNKEEQSSPRPPARTAAAAAAAVPVATTAAASGGADASATALFLRELGVRRRLPNPMLVRFERDMGLLDASGAGIGDDVGIALANVLPLLPAATALRLPDNRLSDAALAAFVAAASRMPALTELDLSRNRVGPVTTRGLSALLRGRNPPCGLRELAVRRAGVDDAACAELVAAVTRNTTLTSLDLSENSLGAAEAFHRLSSRGESSGEAIATMLLANDTLRRLDLSWNGLRSGSAAALASSLAHNGGLEELNLSNNALGDYPCQVLALALCENRRLRRLDLSFTSLGPAAASVLAHALKANATLIWLCLDGNRIGRDGGEALVRAMRLSQRAMPPSP
ncbi:unnamed protein product, partial [Phaeothamnion confervicola]